MIKEVATMELNSTNSALTSKCEDKGGTPFGLLAEKYRQMIEEAAYYRAMRRNFQDGDALQDWLEAEAEIQHMLSKKDALKKHKDKSK